ncbi:early nodulin-like protein 6 [Cornus florida]|uniref:early nodulin-like protein 6 n=1 Tax=Cornus florida TaxID=4283 RepID=UPI0028A198FB|nr:early nodulin-like protein 6 [Cornus florida]
MATIFTTSFKLIILLALSSPLHQPLLVNSAEFEVNDEKGWIIPSSTSNQTYNKWASHHRFQVNDTIRFKYEKDSVLEVSDEEYSKCHSSRPIFFSNNGDTIFEFNRSGLFYFISGVSGHCERGQKMIIKVLETNSSQQLQPPPSPNIPDLSAAVGPTVVVLHKNCHSWLPELELETRVLKLERVVAVLKAAKFGNKCVKSKYSSSSTLALG